VIVRSGMHTESGRVTITQPVSILGENGAVLKIGSEPDPNIVLVAPALYVLRADDVTIWGLEIRPLGPFGNTAIFVQDSARALIGRNSLFDHQTVIGLQHANQARIWGNTINSGGGDGIVCMNGKQVFVRGNDVTNSSFGLWACDENGQASNNNLHGNFIGLILCKVPLASILPDGQMVGSELSAARWIVADNRATGNADAGYLAIDGANHNLVFNNAASNNGTYDIDLAGDTFRFGFLTPLSHDNTVIAGIYRTVRIKDCGVNNQVFGGVHVDTGTDPCY
jgi:nitrous oxidase accessory protein NosD